MTTDTSENGLEALIVAAMTLPRPDQATSAYTAQRGPNALFVQGRKEPD